MAWHGMTRHESSSPQRGGNFEVPTLPNPIGRLAGASSFLLGDVVLVRGERSLPGGRRSSPATTRISAISKAKRV